jgi:endonuclease-8
MPEGPSIVIVKEETQKFINKRVLSVSGNSSEDIIRMNQQIVRDIKSWGKHFLICFDDFTLRIHFLLFGSYRIDERKEKPPRLSLEFDNGELNLYACSVKFLEGDINSHYDWHTDVMNDSFDPKSALKKVKQRGDSLICDILLEQEIFAGVGNIIKNEILYRTAVHPESITASIPVAKLKELINETRIYSFQFLEWKKQYILKKQWLAHAKKMCVRCDLPLSKKTTGVKARRSFFCTNCQKLYIQPKLKS